MATGPSDHSLKLQLHVKDMASGLLGKIKGEFGALGSVIHTVIDMFKNFNIVTMKAAGAMIVMNGVLAGAKLLNMLINMNEEIAVMGQRYAMSRKEIQTFNAQLFKASAQSGIMADQTAHMANTLINAGFKDRNKELANLSTTLFKFEAITGVSAETGADFAAELSKLGYSSDSLLQKLSGLRSSLELSQREMEAVVKVAKDATSAFYLFGGSLNQDKLDANVEGITKLAAVMQHLGINTQTATDFIGTLLDPVKWKESLLTQKLNISFDDVMKFQQGGVGNAGTFLKQIKSQIPGAFGDLNNPAVMNSLKLSKMLTTEELTMLKQIYNMKEKDFQRASDQADITKQQTELYKSMGDVLMPMQKEWIAFLSSIMPLLQTVVVFVTDILRTGSSILQLFKPVGGLIGGIFGSGKESNHMFKFITGGAVLAAILGITKVITKMFANTIKGAIGATQAIETASVATKGFSTIAQTAGKVLKGFGFLGLAGSVTNVFAKKKFEVKDLAGIALSVGMMLGFTPLGIALMAIGALVMLLDNFPKLHGFTRAGIDLQGILGKAEAAETTGIANNIGKTSEEIAAAKSEATYTSSRMWEDIARRMADTATNTAATREALEALTGVTVRHHKENKYDKIKTQSGSTAFDQRTL